MSSVVLESSPTPQVTVDIDSSPQVSLDGGASSITIERTGTTVEIINPEPEVTDLAAQYILLSN